MLKWQSRDTISARRKSFLRESQAVFIKSICHEYKSADKSKFDEPLQHSSKDREELGRSQIVTSFLSELTAELTEVANEKNVEWKE